MDIGGGEWALEMEAASSRAVKRVRRIVDMPAFGDEIVINERDGDERK